jgi:uncharacterized protein (TIGR02391 family)
MEAAGIKTAAVSNRMASIQQKVPMTSNDALLVAASLEGLKMHKYGLDPADLQRLGANREALARLGQLENHAGAQRDPVTPTHQPASPDTRASRFAARNFHEIIVARSRRSFTAGEYQDAVLKAFRSVNNRVKNLASSGLDGQKLMSRVFQEDGPALTLSDRSTESQKNEHEGTRFLMMGAMTGMRNPRAHEDHWPRDTEEAYVLDSLSFASLLHRLLDIAEDRQASR